MSCKKYVVVVNGSIRITDNIDGHRMVSMELLYQMTCFKQTLTVRFSLIDRPIPRL
jgi:hypothetical protein